MKKFRISCLLFTLLPLVAACRTYGSSDLYAGATYYCYEACDGEVVEMESQRQTYWIFEDRSYDDLANKRLITADDMKYLIEKQLLIHPDSAFKGEAKSFIKASNETGLDPIFFFALAGIESAWGTNKTHLLLHNPYSIGMYGDGEHHGRNLGETFGDGIVEGAKFIYENYYKKGQTTLYEMNHVDGHSYCNGDSDWEYQIASEMDYLEGLLANR